LSEAVGQILGEAVGVAISPVPIIAVILMLFSSAAARNSVAFVIGWVTGLAAVGLVVLALGIGTDSGSDSGGIFMLLIGVLFIFLGVKSWRGRPQPGEEAKTPSWMASIDSLSTIKALGMGLLLTVPNPKNAGLTIAASASIGSSGLDTGEELAVLAIYILLASLTIFLPVLYFFFAREKAQSVLDSTKVWLINNNNTVMAVLFVVLGAKILGDGIAGLS
jgi:hypothetical protein